ncbi:hypothetical protein FC83_GL000939 [Agrilactobacillus composti DSM 18527 = JCM 14202]|uniref:Helix-turn-helix domain-containing protein n=1 Tax=Agrilactobacillus composti DSM 18527 = JCM 14202 TaxID=1423734 RepID=A0A0R1Y923_9LACO|nr:hypothetical protein FC83_GL000939 [Agrilactobacillus composti DSM 18527 = JCM 14202]
MPDDFKAELAELITQALDKNLPKQEPELEGFVKLGRAANYADISRTTLDNWLKASYIKQYQIGGNQLISKKELNDFIKQHSI